MARLVPLAAVGLGLGACLRIGTGTGAGLDAGAVAQEAGVPDAAHAVGVNCIEQAQIVLCEEISTCPSVVVPPGAFPNCGFRLGVVGSALDVECFCGDTLCPVGAPTTCGEAVQLLAQQDALLVCEQQSEGRCLRLVPSDASTSPTTCDSVCAQECAGAPSCIQLCGC